MNYEFDWALLLQEPNWSWVVEGVSNTVSPYVPFFVYIVIGLENAPNGDEALRAHLERWAD